MLLSPDTDSVEVAQARPTGNRFKLFSQALEAPSVLASDNTDVAENTADLPRDEKAEASHLVSQLAMQSVLDPAWSEAQSSDSVDDDTAMQLPPAPVSTVQHKVRVEYSLAVASALSRQGLHEKTNRDASCLSSHVSANPASFEITGRARFELVDTQWV